MKIVAGTISGYRDPMANSNLLELYRQILQGSHERCCDVVCLPGGYLTTQSERERDELAKTLVVEAEKYRIAIVIGIDVTDKRSAFAISWSPAEGSTWHTWEQRSSTSANWRTAPNSKRETYIEQRTLTMAEGAIEVLLCGEIFNPVIRGNIVERKDCLTAIVDIAHTSGGSFNRVKRTMMKLANESGLKILLSIHAMSRNTLKRGFGPTGIVVSTDMIIEGPPWAELKIWDI
jgi:hypothetical protein